MKTDLKKTTRQDLCVLRACTLILLLATSCHRSANPVAVDTPPHEGKAWTLLLYDDADFSNAYDPLDSFSENTGSGKNVNVLVLQDQEKGPAAIWYIDEKHNRVKVKDLGEVNMGSESTLYDFLNYAKTIYPSDHLIISFYDHGGGWEGSCWDVTNNSDNLSMNEMQTAITQAGGVDIVMFSAPCLMGAVESVYELRNCAQVYIGSANTSGYCYWMDPMKDLCNLLESSPNIDIVSMGGQIISSIDSHSDRWHAAGYDRTLTMAAIRTDKIARLTAAIDSFSIDCLGDVHGFKKSNDSVYSQVHAYYDSYVDLYDFAENLLKVESRPTTRGKLEIVKQCLSEAVIAECHGTDCFYSHGLNVYFPFPRQSAFSMYYQTQGLDFAVDTHWGRLLASYAFTQKAGKVVREAPQIPPTEGFHPPTAEIKE